MPLHTSTSTPLATFLDGLIASGQLVNWNIEATASYHAITPPVEKGWPAIAFERRSNDHWDIKDAVGGTVEKPLDDVSYRAWNSRPVWFIDEPDYFALMSYGYTVVAGRPAGLWAYKAIAYSGFPGNDPDDIIHVGGATAAERGAFPAGTNGFARRGPLGEVWPDGSMLAYHPTIYIPTYVTSPEGNRVLLPFHVSAAGKYRGTTPSGIRQVMKEDSAADIGQTFTDDAGGTWIEFSNNDDDTVGLGDKTVIAFQYTGGLGYTI